MTLQLSKYRIDLPDEEFVKIFSTRTGELVTVPKKIYGDLITSNFECISDSDLARLKELNILRDSELDELAEILEENKQASGESSVLNILAIPSSNCPLGCNKAEFGGYCGQAHSPGLMSEVVQQQFVESVRRSINSQFKTLSISWFGAEPLSGLKVIRELTSKIKAEAAKCGMVFVADITTGGTLLTPEIARECVNELSIKAFSITLDGCRESHDARRCTKGGRPTFDTITSNIDNILTHHSDAIESLAIRCNVDQRNIEGIEELIEFVYAKGWHKRAELYFVPVHPWGSQKHIQKLTPVEFAAREAKWLRRMAQIGFRIDPLPKRKPTVCRVVSSSHTVIGHDGMIHKCSESPLTPNNAKDDTVGNIGTGDLLAKDHRWSWNSELAQSKYPCSDCVFLPSCGGGCPLSWQRGSDVPCPSYKYNISERIRIFSMMAKTGVNHRRSITTQSEYAPTRLLSALLGDQEDEAFEEFVNLIECALQHARSQRIANAWGLLSKAKKVRFRWSLYSSEEFIRNASVLAAEAYLRFRDGGDASRCLESAILCLDRAKHISANLDVRPAQIQLGINILRTIKDVDMNQYFKGCSKLIKHLNGECSISFYGIRLPATDYGHVTWRSELQAFRKTLEYS